MRREPRIPRYMAIPPGQRLPKPDSATRDAAVVGIAIVFLLLVYWLAPMAVAR